MRPPPFRYHPARQFNTGTHLEKKLESCLFLLAVRPFPPTVLCKDYPLLIAIISYIRAQICVPGAYIINLAFSRWRYSGGDVHASTCHDTSNERYHCRVEHVDTMWNTLLTSVPTRRATRLYCRLPFSDQSLISEVMGSNTGRPTDTVICKLVPSALRLIFIFYLYYLHLLAGSVAQWFPNPVREFPARTITVPTVGEK